MKYSTAHRPEPLPKGRWFMYQGWEDLLFAHWPVPVEVLRERVPPSLELDTFDGQAWIGIVPFRMKDVHLRHMPPLPLLSSFPEINVRTYVTFKGKPGVYFLSMDTTNLLFVLVTRLFANLPYFAAVMSARSVGSEIRYRSLRFPFITRSARFGGQFRPTGEVFHPTPGTLPYFLTERYCLYTVWWGRVFRCDIHHEPWALQPAEADIEWNTMALAHKIELPDTLPLLYYSDVQKTIVWPLRSV
jgi:uncharacterized protein YqjF (DUF2071 family)